MRFTRFLRHDQVRAAKIIAPACALTAQQAQARHVLAIQDTSEVVLNGCGKAAAGFGPVGRGGKARGVLLHAVLAVDAADGSLLGPVDAAVNNRTGGKRVAHRGGRAVGEKESQRWLDGASRASLILAAADQITVISDREGDFYAAFAQKPANVELLTRVNHNRKLKGGKKLFETLDGWAAVSCMKLVVPAAPGRKQRTAVLELRFGCIELSAPKSGMPPAALKALPASLSLSVVDVREIGAPAGMVPLHWRLVTTHVVETVEKALQIIGWYRQRWTVEEYFRTLKTGAFHLEDCEISTPAALMNFVAAAAMAAITVMQLVRARDNPGNLPIGLVFDPEDCAILEALGASVEGKTGKQKNPHPGNSLAHAAWIIGRLGGWDGYYSKPGPLTMSRGLQVFLQIKRGAKLMAIKDK